MEPPGSGLAQWHGTNLECSNRPACRRCGQIRGGAVVAWIYRGRLAAGVGTSPLKVTLGGAPAAIVSAAYSPDRKRIAGGQASGEIAVWDAASGQCLAVLKGHSAAVGALAFSPDGSRIISGAADKTLRVWDAATYVRCW